jgi:hypothetical protein
MEMYSRVVIPGGTAVTYAANSIFVISKAQEKDGTELVGYNFTINIEKSRYVREKSKLPIQVTYENGISKWSGLLDIALETGHVIKPSNGWYQKVNTETGEIAEQKFRLKDTQSGNFWNEVLSNETFKQAIRDRYQLGAVPMTDDSLDQALSEMVD